MSSLGALVSIRTTSNYESREARYSSLILTIPLSYFRCIFQVTKQLMLCKKCSSVEILYFESKVLTFPYVVAFIGCLAYTNKFSVLIRVLAVGRITTVSIADFALWHIKRSHLVGCFSNRSF